MISMCHPRAANCTLPGTTESPTPAGRNPHEDQLEAYASSVHAEEVLDKGSMKGAVCTDCHPAHQVVNTSSEKFKLGNVNTCGSCHKEALKSYTDTYHGQVNRLGGAYTAKCADCHDSHGIRGADDPKSKVHPKNRMKTCTKCHTTRSRACVMRRRALPPWARTHAEYVRA